MALLSSKVTGAAGSMKKAAWSIETKTALIFTATLMIMTMQGAGAFTLSSTKLSASGESHI